MSALNLVEMSEQVETSFTRSVIQLSVCQHPTQSTLTRVNVTQHRYSEICPLKGEVGLDMLVLFLVTEFWKWCKITQISL